MWGRGLWGWIWGWGGACGGVACGVRYGGGLKVEDAAPSASLAVGPTWSRDAPGAAAGLLFQPSQAWRPDLEGGFMVPVFTSHLLKREVVTKPRAPRAPREAGQTVPVRAHQYTSGATAGGRALLWVPGAWPGVKQRAWGRVPAGDTGTVDGPMSTDFR